ncbi:DUF6783 domain-containing protein [Blautia glucerasea]|uniref:DUF6783 domain-containing protein n=1 Tax=Blautia glucerasea TaxID=536633 RepID=UPI00299F79EE|nr:DUF6783 domain-containing protein [Blautia glucerasea]
MFCLNLVVVARDDNRIQAKSPTNCDTHLAESLFQTHSGVHGVNSNICFVDKCLKKQLLEYL